MKKRLFLDTNIVIDFLAKREPFGKEAYVLFKEKEQLNIELYISALSYTTIYYVLRKNIAHEQLIALLQELQRVVVVAPVNQIIIDSALASDFKDFEDAIQYYSAISAGTDMIITRNLKDYTKSTLKVLTTSEFLYK